MSEQPVPLAVRVLAEQLRRPGVLPPALHHAAWQTARQHPALRLQLANRVDAPADLVVQYRTHRDPHVRAAYLCRADHSEQVLRTELAGEYRGGLLAVLAENDRDRPHLQTIVEEKFRLRPGLRLARTLLDSIERRDPRTQLAVLQFLLPQRDTLGGVVAQKLRHLVEFLSDDGVYADETATAVAGDTDLSRLFFARIALSIPTRTALLAGLDPADPQTALLLGNLLSLPDLQPELLPALTAAVDALPATNQQAQTMLRARLHTHTHRPKSPELVSVHDLLVRAQGGDPFAARRVLFCDELALPDRIALVTTAAKPMSALLDVARDTPAPVPVPLLDAIALHDPAGFAEHGGWQLYPDLASAQVRLVHAACARAQKARLLTSLLRAGLDRPGLLLVPWCTFAAAVVNATADSRWNHTLSTFTAAQVDVLGQDPAAWETFTLLAEDFPGTVGELLHTCAAVHRG